MPESGEVLVQTRTVPELIDLINESQQNLVQVKEAAGTVHTEESIIIDAAKARVKAADDKVREGKEHVGLLYKELVDVVVSNPGDDPNFALGIIYGNSLEQAHEIKNRLDSFNQLIAAEGTPVLRVGGSDSYKLAMATGGPLLVTVGRRASDTEIQIPVTGRVSITRQSSHYPYNKGHGLRVSEDPLRVYLPEVSNPSTGDYKKERWPFDRDWEEVFVGVEAVNKFIQTIKNFEQEYGNLRSISESTTFAFWVATRWDSFQNHGIEITVDEETISAWQQDLKRHAINYLLSRADRQRDDIINPELLKAGLRAFETSSDEAMNILREADAQARWSYESDTDVARRYDLFKVYMKHDLGLSLPEEA